MKSQITYSADGKSIIKTCRSVRECEQELLVYNLNLNFTPRLIQRISDTTIELSLIRGSSLAKQTDFDFSQPAEKLSLLHRSLRWEDKVLCHIDTNPRNYLIEEKSGFIYLIDFSESGFSYPENDLVNFLLFWAAILPVEQFQNAMSVFLQGYGAPDLLRSKGQDTLFTEYVGLFDERRRRYCKQPATTYDWQISNRNFLLQNFLRILSNL